MIPEGTARRDALRLTKARAKNLPRVTAYATAKSVQPLLQSLNDSPDCAVQLIPIP
jgi:hypothetical protein